MLSYCSFIILWVISGIRYEVGTDFSFYYTYINVVKSIDIKNNEYGMWLLGSFINSFTNNGQVFILITSLIIIFFLFKTIEKNSTYPEISILLLFGLGFYFTSLNILRQYIALSIVFYSLKYLFDKKYWRYSFLILLATMFHYSAIIAFGLIIVTKIQKQSIVNRILTILAFVCFLAFYNKILLFLIPSQYSGYEDSEFLNKGANFIFFILYLVITIILHIFRKQLVQLNEKNEYYLFLILIGTGISLLGTQSLIIQRLASYFTISAIIILPDLIKIVKDKNLRIIAYLGIVGISFVGMYLFLSRNLGEVLPYNTFFNSLKINY